MTREKIKKIIEKSIKEIQKEGITFYFKIEDIKIEIPEQKKYGDYATNIAMIIGKRIKKNPMEIANILKLKIKSQKLKLFKKIEIVEPGFINFFVSENHLQSQLKEILKKKNEFGDLKIGKNKKTNIEFISVNPTGPLHIGHGRGAFFGDVLANVLKKAGYQVFREYFVNDSKTSTQIQELGKTALGKGESYLSPYLSDLILKLKPYFKNINSESELGFFVAQNIVGETRNFVEKKLKIKFNYWISEHNLYRQGKIKKIYEFLKNKNLVYQKEGAFWLKLSDFGQKDEVLIRKNGQPTYFLSDIAYHKDKIDRGFEKIIDIWGADHQGHIPRMKTVMELLGFKGEFDILISQIVKLKGKKMSKRKGEVITLEWLLNELNLDLLRFFYLRKSLESQMEFDLELAKKESEKNPLYYIQYAHARICSIFKKVKSQKSKVKTTNQKLKLLNHPSELLLIKQLIRFPEIIEDTAKDYQVQRIPQYALDLATAFHQFYRDCKVLTEAQPLLEARLALISATKIILNNTLSLMGISAPEKM